MVAQMIDQRKKMDEAMTDMGCTELQKTAAGMMKMLKAGDVTVREVLLISTMLPGVGQAERNTKQDKKIKRRKAHKPANTAVQS